MKTILLIQFLILSSYVIYVVIEHGIQKSISDSWYVVKYTWMFPWMCGSIGFLHILHSELHLLFFLSGSFLCFTGAASAFKKIGMTHTIHFVGAGGAILTSCLGLGLIGVPEVIIFNAVFAATFYLMKVKNSLWWIEIVAFLSILVGLLQIYMK